MFRTIAGNLLLLVFLGMACHYILIRNKSGAENGGDFLNLIKSFLQEKTDSKSWFSMHRIQLGFYLLTLLTFLILLLTGMLPLLFFNQSLSGFPLLLHAAVSPIFAVCLLLWIVMSISDHLFYESDRFLIKKHKWMPGIKKICFWIIVIPAFPVIISIVLSMFAWFGTPEQILLAKIHRFSALLLSSALILHLYCSILTAQDSSAKI